ncbi:hypothetical protein [Paracidovorax wautersii]|uniref:hypothetical protein n=1 Tax=Paracidovorax wautersii TaxID=1177982 RepID=UPI001587F245|nr:hypothetical protein [Paracidovorax wautersii]
MAPNGKAVAAWLEARQINDNTTLYSVHARAYSPDTGWGNSVAFATTGNIGANLPEVVVNANGDAILLWRQSEVMGNNLAVNTIRYNAGTGVWDAAPAAVLSDAEATLYQGYDWINSHHITLDNNGNAFYAFSVSTILNAPDGAWVKQYRNGVWSDAVRFLAGASSNAKDLQLAAAPDGRTATAIWKQFENNANKFRMLASEYREGSGWTTGHEIDGDLVKSFGSTKIAIAANGDTTAVWEGSSDVGGSRFYAARLSNGAWSAPVTVGNTRPVIAFDSIAGLCSDAAGNAVLVTLPSQITAIRFTVDQGWQAPVDIPPAEQSYISPQASVACNTKGDAMVSYRAALGANNSYDLWARPFSATSGWGTAAQIVSLGGPAGMLTLSTPVVGVDDSFRALTLWRQDQQSGSGLNKPRDLWSATYK